MFPALDKSMLARLSSLAWPMIMANITIPLLAFVDTIVLGHLSDHRYLAAVALGDIIFSFLFLGLGFLRMSTTGFTAVSLGQQDFTRLRTILSQSLILALVAAGILLLFQQVILLLSHALLTPPKEVTGLLDEFFSIRVWASPAALANAVLVGWLLGMSRTRSVLIMISVVNVLAIVLDVFFVFYLNMDVRGVALAIAIGQYAGMLTGFFLVSLVLKRYTGQWSLKAICGWQGIQRLASANQDLLIRSVCLMFTLGFVMRESAQMGSLIVAVNGILMTLIHFLAYTLDGFTMAAETCIGQAVGKQKRDEVITIVINAAYLCLLLGIVYALVYAGLGHVIIRGMTDIAVVRAEFFNYMAWVVVSPLIAGWAYLFDGVFIGLTMMRPMRNTMLLSMVVFMGIWLLAKPWGNHGLWLALMCFLAMRGLSLGLIFIRKNKRDRLFAMEQV